MTKKFKGNSHLLKIRIRKIENRKIENRKTKKFKTEKLKNKMQTLAQMAASNIPYQYLAWLYPHEKFVINFELSSYIKGSRSTRGRILGNLCDCEMNGECLCYFDIIRTEMIEQFWADESDYERLIDWLEFP